MADIVAGLNHVIEFYDKYIISIQPDTDIKWRRENDISIYCRNGYWISCNPSYNFIYCSKYKEGNGEIHYYKNIPNDLLNQFFDIIKFPNFIDSKMIRFLTLGFKEYYCLKLTLTNDNEEFHASVIKFATDYLYELFSKKYSNGKRTFRNGTIIQIFLTDVEMIELKCLDKLSRIESIAEENGVYFEHEMFKLRSRIFRKFFTKELLEEKDGK